MSRKCPLKMSAQLFSDNYIRICSFISLSQVICPPETAFLQFVWDNTDHNINIVDSQNKHYGLGSIVVANGNSSSESKQRKPGPRNKKQSWPIVDFNESIRVRKYIAQDKRACKQIFCGQLCSKSLKTIFQTLYRTALAFTSNIVQAGWAT